MQVSRRLLLATIDPTTDVSLKAPGSAGSLILCRRDDSYQLIWLPQDSSQSPAAALSSPSRFKEDVWKPNAEFRVECSQIGAVRFGSHPLSLEVVRRDGKAPRAFSFTDAEFISVAEFVEQLLVNGICVPTCAEPFCLVFYRRCRNGVYPYPPAHIQLCFFGADLSAFWTAAEDYYQRLVVHLDASETMPRDPGFPVDVGAETLHSRVMRECRAWAANIPVHVRIVPDEWDGLFDASGRLVDPLLFKRRIYHAGIDNALLPRALPFIFGVFALDSTLEQRTQLRRRLDEEFALLLEQAVSYGDSQVAKNRKLSAAFRVIQHDVSRTDRQLSAFATDNGIGLLMVTHLLQAYCVFNPPIGYLQGMNDLFVPILLPFCPSGTTQDSPSMNVGKCWTTGSSSR
jgi:hypothetical protein